LLRTKTALLFPQFFYWSDWFNRIYRNYRNIVAVVAVRVLSFDHAVGGFNRNLGVNLKISWFLTILNAFSFRFYFHFQELWIFAQLLPDHLLLDSLKALKMKSNCYYLNISHKNIFNNQLIVQWLKITIDSLQLY